MKHTRDLHTALLLCRAVCIVAIYIFAPLITSSHGQEVRTPAAPDKPRINGPTIFGVTPGSPVLYKIPATGDGTITYSIDNMPAGLSVNSSTGMITGSLTTRGTYTLTLRATNSLGSNTKQFRIVVGDTIALTPPLGWNSYNVWGTGADATKWLAAAHGMADSGLINYGWTYVNIDDGWQASREGQPYTALQGNSRFPDMQSIADQIHALNLKVGIYSTPWVQSYGGYPGGSAMSADGHWVKNTGTKQVNKHILPWDVGPYQFETNDATQWAQWGIDYLKYDWNPIELPETQAMEQALRNSGRDVVYSLSNSIPFSNIAQLAPHANAWRTTGDIRDNWSSMSSKGFGQDKWAPYQSPGHWNDPDMMVVGAVGWGSPHPTNLTPDEQYTHITLWSLMSAPMLLGNDLTKMDQPGEDPFTLNLLTNSEVLAVHQDALGNQATTKYKSSDGNLRVYSKILEDGSTAVGLFNLGATPATVTANWSDIGISGANTVRDLWREVDKGDFNGSVSMVVAPHGSEMLRVFPVQTLPGTNWSGGNGAGPTNWGLPANWASGVVPNGAGSKVSLGTQNPSNNIIDMVSVGRTVGNIDFSASTGTTIQSSGGYSLTIDNNDHDSMIKLSGSHTISAPMILNSDANIAGTGSINVSGRISGAHGLYLQSGNLTLSNTNIYTGPTVIYNGTVQINTDNALPYGTGKGDVNLSSYAAVLEMNNHILSINGLYGTAGSIRNSGATAKQLTLGSDNSNGDYWGTIDGNVILYKSGTGIQTISGNNSYSGGTIINAGTLKTGNDKALSGAANGTSVLNSATLDINAMYLGDEQISVQGAGAGGQGAIVNNNTTTARYQNSVRFVTLLGDATFGGATSASVSGSGRWDIRANPTASLSTGGHAYNLTKTGGNQITLAGVAVDTALANVNINQGIISLESSSTLGDPNKTVTVGSSGTLQLYKLTTPLNKKIQLNGGTIYAHTNGSSSDNTIIGNITLGSGGGVLDAGGQRLPDRSTPSSAAFLTINGAISGASSLSLTKKGPGTVTLTGNNSFSGSTSLNDGTLVVNGSLAGNLTLNDNNSSSVIPTLSGTGSIGGTTQDAATTGYTTIISPAGNGTAGTLTLHDLILNGFGQLDFDLTNNPAAGNDLLNLTGNLTLTSGGITTIAVNLLSGSLAEGTYHLMHYNGTATGSPASYFTISGTPVGQQTYSIVQNAAQKYVDLLVSTANLVWKGDGRSNYWDVNITPNWLNNGNAALFTNINNVTFDDTGSNSPAVYLSGTLTPASITVNNNLKNYTFSGTGAITGNTGLTKTGTGTLVLSNTGANTYTGTTTITAGKVQLGDGMLTGCRLGSGPIVNNAALVLNNPAGDNYTISSIISGTGSLEIKGGDTVALSGANTYSGPTTITAGILKAGTGVAFGSGSVGTTIASGGTLDVNGQNLTAEAVTVQGSGAGNNGTIINSGAQQTYALKLVTLTGDTTFGGSSRWDIRASSGGSLSTGGQAFNLTKVGANEIAFVYINVDSALGNININQGILGFQTSTTSMGNPSKTVTIESGAVLNFWGTSAVMNKNAVLNGGTIWAEYSSSNSQNTFAGPITLNSAGGIFDAGDGLTGGSANTSAILNITGNNISGSGGLTKNGPGSVYITSPLINYSGNTTINAGTLQIKSGASANIALHNVTGLGELGLSSVTTIRADSINIGTLTIGAGSKVILNPQQTGRSLAAYNKPTFVPVPEPGTIIMLLMFALTASLLTIRRLRI